MEEVIIEIDKTGERVKITVNGCTGEACKDLTSAVEKALGVVTKDQPTEEMYAEAKSRVVNRG